MTAEINMSDPNQAAQVHPVKPRLRWPLVAIAALMVALVVGFLLAGQPAPENQTQTQRVLLTEAARYSGLARYYLAKEEANQQRAIEAETTRYTSLAKFYLTENKSSLPQVFEAEAARYNALAAYYLKKGGPTGSGLSRPKLPGTMAWPVHSRRLTTKLE
jgi:hypothetical protein